MFFARISVLIWTTVFKSTVTSTTFAKRDYTFFLWEVEYMALPAFWLWTQILDKKILVDTIQVETWTYFICLNLLPCTSSITIRRTCSGELLSPRGIEIHRTDMNLIFILEKKITWDFIQLTTSHPKMHEQEQMVDTSAISLSNDLLRWFLGDRN